MPTEIQFRGESNTASNVATTGVSISSSWIYPNFISESRVQNQSMPTESCFRGESSTASNVAATGVSISSSWI